MINQIEPAYNEFKYTVAPWHLDTVSAILEAVMGRSDPYSTGWVESVYYDSITRHSLGQCRNGSERKIKFRIRRYNDQTNGQLQIKLKDHFGVAKYKSAYPYPDTPYPTWPTATEGNRDALAIRTISRGFPFLRPMLNVRYFRHRYRFMNYRVTFDRRISATACAGLTAPRHRGVSVPFAILEVKTKSASAILPPGIRDRVQLQSFSKYGILARVLLGEPDMFCKYQPTAAHQGR